MLETFWTVFIGGSILWVLFHAVLFILPLQNNSTDDIVINTIQPKPVSVAKPATKKKPKMKSVSPKPVEQKPAMRITSDENINLVISGLVHIGMKKTNAKALVIKMCKNRYYDDAQALFEACFPYIK